jgi:hypothetical protein
MAFYKKGLGIFFLNNILFIILWQEEIFINILLTIAVKEEFHLIFFQKKTVSELLKKNKKPH